MFVCKSISLANFLLANGSNLIKIDKDKENNKFLVFIFNDNNLLNENLKKWNKK